MQNLASKTLFASQWGFKSAAAADKAAAYHTDNYKVFQSHHKWGWASPPEYADTFIRGSYSERQTS